MPPKDGRLDLFINGQDNGSRLDSQLWRNTGSGFVNVTAQVAPGLTPIANGGGFWGDYDNDGRPDRLLTGLAFGYATTEIWHNTPGGFVNVTSQVAPGLPALREAVAAWGDFDGDGRLDFVIMGGNPDIGSIAQLWRNTGSGFTEVSSSFAPGLPAVTVGSVAWGDYENDGRLDLLIAGCFGNTPTAQLWHLRVGTAPGGSDLLGPMASAAGLRRLPAMGNAQQALALPVADLALGRYYWSVQSVDGAFAGSPFAAEQSFTLAGQLAPPGGQAMPGDSNGDGVVDQNELDAVLAHYWPSSPWLLMTNVAGLGGTNVSFALSNSVA